MHDDLYVCSLHYDVRGYFEAMADTFANLDKVGNGHEHEKKAQ
jgi:hypothetical protein